MALLRDLWPTELRSLRYTLQLQPEELDWEGLAGAANGLSGFRVYSDSLRATIPGRADDGDFHGHLYVDRDDVGGYTVEWTLSPSGVTGVGDAGPDLPGLPTFLGSYLRVGDAEPCGTSVAVFLYDLARVVPVVPLPLTPPPFDERGPVIAGLDFEYPESSPVLRRAFITRFTEQQQLQVTLMLDVPFTPAQTLLDRLLGQSASTVQSFVEPAHSPAADAATA